MAERGHDDVAPVLRRLVEAPRILSVEMHAEAVVVPPALVVLLGRAQAARTIVVVIRTEVHVAACGQVVSFQVRGPRRVVVLSWQRQK